MKRRIGQSTLKTVMLIVGLLLEDAMWNQKATRSRYIYTTQELLVDRSEKKLRFVENTRSRLVHLVSHGDGDSGLEHGELRTKTRSETPQFKNLHHSYSKGTETHEQQTLLDINGRKISFA